MSGPRTENRGIHLTTRKLKNRKTGGPTYSAKFYFRTVPVDSLLNQHPSLSIETECSRVQGQNYEDYAEESCELQHQYLIGHKVLKRFGEKMCEGAVESYNIVNDKFKVVYENGYFVEIGGGNINTYLEQYRNNGTSAFPSACVQPFKELPRGYPTGDMAEAEINSEGRGRKRPLMMRAQNAGGSSRPRHTLKNSVHSLCSKRQRHENIAQGAPVQPPTDVGTEGRIRTRAPRMRAQNAHEISRAMQARKPRFQSLSGRCPRKENINQPETVQPPTDVVKGRTRALRMRAQNAGDISRPRQAGKPRVQSSSRRHPRRENGNETATRNPPTDAGIERSGRTRALRMRAQNAGDISRPRQAGQGGVQSSSRRHPRRENVDQTATGNPPADADIQRRGRTRALRMRAQNAGDICRPSQAGKCRAPYSSRIPLLYQEYKRSAYVYYNPGGNESDEDSYWEV